MPFLVEGEVLAAQPADGDELYIVVVVEVGAAVALVDVLDAYPVDVVGEVLGGDDEAQAVRVAPCGGAHVDGAVGDGELEVAAVLHGLVVGNAVVVGLRVVDEADAGVVGVDAVVDGDAADLVVDIELDDASLAAGDVAHAYLVGALGDARQAVGEVELSLANAKVAVVLVVTSVGGIVGESAPLLEDLYMLTIAFGDEEAGRAGEGIACRTIVPAHVVVGELGNEGIVVETDDAVEHEACHHVLVIDQGTVDEVDGAVEGFLVEVGEALGFQQHFLGKSDGRVEIIDKKNVDLVSRLTDGIWTAQHQNIFLASHDDILLVEGSSDIVFIQSALDHFKSQGRYTDLSFECIPCGGASHMKDFASIFKPKENQMVIGFLDGDRAGRESMHNVINCLDSGAKEWDVKKFGKARKCGDVWFSFYPVWKGKKNAENFNVEDYFTCQLFRKYILSFSSLDTIRGKEGLKSKLEQECKNGKILSKYFEKFSTLFDHIRKIKDAEMHHLTTI